MKVQRCSVHASEGAGSAARPTGRTAGLRLAGRRAGGRLDGTLDKTSTRTKGGNGPSSTITCSGLRRTYDTWTWLWEEKGWGKPTTFRIRQVQLSPTAYTIKVDYSVAGGSWTVIEEGRATKVK